MLGEGINQLLLAATPITALIGTPATRDDGKSGVWPVQAPESATYPMIVYSQISGEGNPSYDGANALHQCRISFGCYGENYGDSKRLQVAIRQLIEGFHGVLPDGTPVDNAVLVLELDAFEDAPFSYNSPIDFLFVYTDTGAGEFEPTPGPCNVIDGGSF
jgi:hypothetical protein